MRKGLVILLIFAVAAAVAAPAAALEFPDVPGDADYAQAVDYISDLGIMIGDGAGMFNPDSTVTRVEMAAVICRMMMEDSDLPALCLDFSDVPPSHWAGPYTARASELGVINGYGDGRFGPDDPVTYEQAVTMVVRAKGLDNAARDRGGYPDGYLAVAGEMGYLENISSEPDRPFSRAEVARLVFNSIVDWRASAELLEEAARRREAFYAKSHDVEPTGRVYYISPSGDDRNDGLTPDTAWATLDRAFETWWPLTRSLLKPGDTVLLERGGTWYVRPDRREGLTSDAYSVVDGVTLGAYGEGPRPVIRGDVPEANDPGFWSLYYDRDGVKIWASAEKLQDSTVIVFNGGEAWAEEVMPCWSTRLRGYSNAAGEPFSVPEELGEDLTFCCLLDLDRGYEAEQDLGNAVNSGTVYLRCDAGNPAEVFGEVALPQAQTGLLLHTGAAVSGLDIRYFTCLAAELSSYDGQSGQSLSDCELSWCGGLLSIYQPDGAFPDEVLRPYCAGGAVQISGSGNSVKDCYIHHCGPMTLILSIHYYEQGGISYRDMRYSGNLIEYCGGVMHIADLAKMDRPGTEGFISNLTYEDNMVFYSGEGWIEGLVLQTATPDSGFLSAVENVMGAANNDGIDFINNVFYGARGNLIALTDGHWNGSGTVNRPMRFSGNVYAQPYGRPLGVFNWTDRFTSGLAPDEAAFLARLGDPEGTVVHIP